MFIIIVLTLFAGCGDSDDMSSHYVKYEELIPMRDGTKLFTSIYVPKDTSQKYPIMLNRTPYSVAPYGEDAYRNSLGPSIHFAREGYIFVYQDVRGKFRSEGEFEFMRPHKPNKTSPQETDESSDAYDTIEWLVKNLRHHNGKVGMWGISYPGYQVAMGIIDAHPALVAASPQAPMADVFVGDDFHHNGAFFLSHAFGFLNMTAPSRTDSASAAKRPPRFDYGTPDGYRFFMELGPVANANSRYLKHEVPIWNEFMEHGAYDRYWQERNVIPHLKNIKPAVLTVGGWFDSEDPYGASHIYGKIENANPGISNALVFGPWQHGGWARIDGDTLGNIRFGIKTSLWYREHVEFPFFNYYLKGKGEQNPSEVWAFVTGKNEWKSYDQWPPKEAKERNLFLREKGALSFAPPRVIQGSVYDEYVSDPAKPVPFTAQTTTSMGHLFMVEDQRFASTRPDVLVYESGELEEELTIAGPIAVELYGSTSGTDCDWIVKLIDVFPGNAPDNNPNPSGVRMGHFQMMVGGEVIRSKFRSSLEKPEPMTPNTPTKIAFNIPDKHHTFLKGHRIMVQVQSTWFPLVDRNPGKYVDIYNARESDFAKTTQRVHRSAERASHLKLLVIDR